MAPTESTLIDRIHGIATAQAVDGGRLSTLEGEKDLLWSAIDKIRDAVSGLRAQVAAIVAGSAIVQTIVTAFIVWKITKG